MNTDTRDKYTVGSVLPPFKFGFGNIGLDLKKGDGSSERERLFVGAHGKYTLRVTDKKRFLRALGSEVNEYRLREMTMPAVRGAGREALGIIALNSVYDADIENKKEEFEIHMKEALEKSDVLAKLGVTVEKVTSEGFYVRDEKSELPTIVVENEKPRRTWRFILVAAFAVMMIAAVIVTAATIAKNPSDVITPTSEKYFKYVAENNRITITGYSGKDENVVIPYEIDGVKVKEIAENAFSGNAVMKKVTILPGVEKMGDGAFSACENLEYVNIPGSVVLMGNGMFLDCVNLSEIYIGDMAVTNGEYSFKNCASLKEIHIGESVDYIERGEFESCVSLETVDMPNLLQGIRERAFADCTSLDHIILTYMTKTIDEGAFSGCSSMKYIIIPPSVTEIAPDAFSDCPLLTIYCDSDSYAEEYAKKNGIRYRFTGEKLTDDKNGIRYEINPDGTLTMSEYIGGATNKLVIPSVFEDHKVVAIGDYAFSDGNAWITELEVSDGIERFEESAFCGAKIKYISIPASVTTLEMGQNPFRYNYFVHFTVSPQSKTLKADESGKFLLSADGKELYAYACGLNDDNAVIPGGVEKLMNQSFSSSMIKSVEIPGSVYYIDWSVFINCSRLESVHISKNVIHIEGSAFLLLPKLERLTVDEGNPVYRSENNVIFDSDGNFIAVAPVATERVYVIPQCTRIWHDALCGSKRIVHVVIPDGVIEICSRAFIDCTNLRTVYIPESVAEIGWSVFEYDWKHEYPKTIYGVAGSAAESYVAENGYAFASTKIVGDEIHIVKVTLNGQKSVNIPETIDGRTVVIDDGAFDGVSGITVYGELDGTAQEFAKSAGYKFQKETTGV